MNGNSGRLRTPTLWKTVMLQATNKRILNCWYHRFLIQKLRAAFGTKSLLELGGDECDNLNFMNFIKLTFLKFVKKSWILGNFKIRKIRILDLWIRRYGSTSLLLLSTGLVHVMCQEDVCICKVRQHVWHSCKYLGLTLLFIIREYSFVNTEQSGNGYHLLVWCVSCICTFIFLYFIFIVLTCVFSYFTCCTRDSVSDFMNFKIDVFKIRKNSG